MKKIFYPILFCAIATSLQTVSPRHTLAHGNQVASPKANKLKTYRNVKGQVVTIIKAKRAGEKTAVTLDHEEIPNFMRAMRMTIPLQNSADAKKLKKGTKIRFDLVLKSGNFLISNVKLLSSRTRLKLAPA